MLFGSALVVQSEGIHHAGIGRTHQALGALHRNIVQQANHHSFQGRTGGKSGRKGIDASACIGRYDQMQLFIEELASGDKLKVFDCVVDALAEVFKRRTGCAGGLTGGDKPVVPFHNVK